LNYSLEDLSNGVFGLEKDYKLILKYIALNDTLEKGVTVTEIKNFFDKEKKRDWKTVNRMLIGPKRPYALEPLGFVQKKKKGSKQKYIFHLTFKGFLASLSTGISLEMITIYSSYIEFIKRYVNDESIFQLIENYIKNEILIFLLLHSMSHILLREIINLDFYFKKFFRDEQTMFLLYDVIKIRNDKKLKSLDNTIREYKVILEILKGLGIPGGIFAEFFMKKPLSNDPYFEIPNSTKRNHYEPLYSQWPNLMETLFVLDPKNSFDKFLETLQTSWKRIFIQNQLLPQFTERDVNKLLKEFKVTNLVKKKQKTNKIV